MATGDGDEGYHLCIPLLLMLQKSGDSNQLRLVDSEHPILLFDGFYISQVVDGGCLGFLNHQQYDINDQGLTRKSRSQIRK